MVAPHAVDVTAIANMTVSALTLANKGFASACALVMLVAHRFGLCFTDAAPGRIEGVFVAAWHKARDRLVHAVDRIEWVTRRLPSPVVLGAPATGVVGLAASSD